jgi:hypothetical protein
MDKLFAQKINKPWLGVVIGLLLPAILVIVLYFVNPNGVDSLGLYLKRLSRMGTFLPVLSIATLINLIPFYLFKRLELWYANRGVVFSIFLYLVLVVVLKFA